MKSKKNHSRQNQKKKFFVILVFFIFIFQINYSQINEDSSLHTITKIADKVDPQNIEFPGGRGANELVVYTPDFGDSTGTNKYGIEAIVIEDKIQTISGNNSKIPRNGFVISGHGSQLQWISKELYPGIEVKLLGKELQFNYSDQSKIFYADYLVNEVDKKINAESGLHESISLEKINKIKNEINELKQKKIQLPDSILDKSFELYYNSFPSLKKELRASWYHLKEKSPEELENTIKRMSEIGFNTICPEVIYGGYAIYPNAHCGLKQHPDFIGWDPMNELVKLCKKYNMQLIPWVWVFFVGKENSPLVESKKEWLAISRQNENPARMENNYHFFCPSKKEVTKFWLEVYSNLLENYKIDGLQLDYIRYPVSLPNEHGFCYCETCRNNFKDQTQFDPLKITEEGNPELWKKWIEYRKEQITSFVKNVKVLIEEKQPTVKLSADVFPLFEESINFKFQDWGNWLNNNYLDEIFTMSYTPEAEQVKYESEFLIKHLPKGIKGYVGLGPFMGFRPEILVKEIFYTQQSGANGVCFFSFGSLKQEQINALMKGPFREKAIFK
ncbi:MAG: family 10 glycosylhydrolase [Ignavibacteriae bacterium]|nr:family 10 glycosylhydrolase [Ignavibacteriota bacterium]MCB9208905.1 family 10 glycosylhydrolase [Ignavibacteriales bacterium]